MTRIPQSENIRTFIFATNMVIYNSANQLVYSQINQLVGSVIRALIAQLDRVADFESVGRGFDSLWAHHIYE